MDSFDDSRIGAGVTTGVLARKVGISPTTLRSWDRRYGLGPAARIEGHHRRWSPEDVVMVQEMCNLTARGVPPAEAARAAKDWAAEARSAAKTPATRMGRRLTAIAAPSSDASTTPPGTLSNTDLRRRCKGIARAALRMDTIAVHEQITEAIESYGVLTAWEEVITPTLLSIGRKWESSDDKYVEVEHLLSWHVSVALHNAYARTIATDKPPGNPCDPPGVPAQRGAHSPPGGAHRHSGGARAARHHAGRFGAGRIHRGHRPANRSRRGSTVVPVTQHCRPSPLPPPRRTPLGHPRRPNTQPCAAVRAGVGPTL